MFNWTFEKRTFFRYSISCESLSNNYHIRNTKFIWFVVCKVAICRIMETICVCKSQNNEDIFDIGSTFIYFGRDGQMYDQCIQKPKWCALNGIKICEVHIKWFCRCSLRTLEVGNREYITELCDQMRRKQEKALVSAWYIYYIYIYIVF